MNIYHFKCWTCGIEFAYQKKEDATVRAEEHRLDAKLIHEKHETEVWEEIDYGGNREGMAKTMEK